MHSYIIDWGDNCTGGRYAIISAIDSLDLIEQIDFVKDPSYCKYCNLTEWLYHLEEIENYLELGNNADYMQSLESLVKQMPWKNITERD